MSISVKASPAVDLATVADGFQLHGRYLYGEPYGSGHINDTYAVIFDQAGTRVRYIFQRINNRIFKDIPALMDNILRVTKHATQRASELGATDSARRALTLVLTRDGRPCLQDRNGGYWRCYYFIEQARSYDLVTSPRQAYEAAKAFGEFQRLLVDLPGARLHETIRDFHHTRRRFEDLRQAIHNDVCKRASGVCAEIDFAMSREAIVDVLLNLLSQGLIPERITHNDTKFNNVLLDDRSNEALCVIDLDTVMPGLALYDFGDMVRSATNSAAEDETDLDMVSMRLPVFSSLVAGYLASAGKFLNAAERSHLVFSGKLITFEIGLRFLTDYLAGDVYFKIRRPDHNLHRCRNQFALMRSIECQEKDMNSVVEAILSTL